MSGVMGVLSYGIGTILGLVLRGLILFWFVQDVTQKKHTVLRSYPVIGRLRYFLGSQYFFAGYRDEMPFNRASGGGYRIHGTQRGLQHALSLSEGAAGCQAAGPDRNLSRAGRSVSPDSTAAG